MSFLSSSDVKLIVNELRNNVITKPHSKFIGISILGQIYVIHQASVLLPPTMACFNFHDVNICPNSYPAIAGYVKCLNLDNAPVLASHKRIPWSVSSYGNFSSV